MQRDLSFGSYMNVSHITVSFLNYGPETGGQRCMVAMARASGDQVKGMVFQITGAGNQASFQSIFFLSLVDTSYFTASGHRLGLPKRFAAAVCDPVRARDLLVRDGVGEKVRTTTQCNKLAEAGDRDHRCRTAATTNPGLSACISSQT